MNTRVADGVPILFVTKRNTEIEVSCTIRSQTYALASLPMNTANDGHLRPVM